MEILPGILTVSAAGLMIGSMVWPQKVCRSLSFEHQWLPAMLAGLLVIPWAITLLGCPGAFDAYREVGASVLLKANLFSLAWGIANVLLGISVVRIGAGLTFAVLTGVGATLGVLVPMVFKGSGLFASAPSLLSRPGLVVTGGALVMILGVVLTGIAGVAREAGGKAARGGFVSGLLTVVLAGILSAGISFTFVFSQGPIVAAMKARGAGDIAANASVWAVALLGGALVNVLYPLFLLWRNRSWDRLRFTGQVLLSTVIGIQFFAGVLLMGRGMVLLGALGASVGFGIAQGLQILGAQILGAATGEWSSASSPSKRTMLLAVFVLLLAATIMAVGNFLSAG